MRGGSVEVAQRRLGNFDGITTRRVTVPWAVRVGMTGPRRGSVHRRWAVACRCAPVVPRVGPSPARVGFPFLGVVNEIPCVTICGGGRVNQGSSVLAVVDEVGGVPVVWWVDV